MGNVLIIAILIVIVICAISPTIKHFKGEGGCCGGGSTVKEKKKKLSAPQIGTKKIKIEGMHCKNCVNRVTNAVNQIDGAVCKVNLKKRWLLFATARRFQMKNCEQPLKNRAIGSQRS